jgi:large subunit ribosomal protein L35e
LIRENKRNAVVSKLRTRTTTEGTGDQAKTIETTIKNLKFKHIPLDLRPKRTRAIRRRLTKFESKLVTLRQFKRRLNFPVRRFAVPLH